MTGFWRLALAFMGLLLVGEAASAQPTVSQMLNAPAGAGAKAVIAATEKRCLKANGHMLVVEPGALRSVDLTGNRRTDYIIDFNFIRCERLASPYCGTGGCELSIVVALPGRKFREVFHQQVLRYELEPSDGSMRTIRFDLHGTYCGKTGPEPCRQRQLITGQRFEFKQPQ